MRYLLQTVMLLAALAMVGCHQLDYTIARRSAIDAQIAAARVETESRLQTLTAQQIGLLQQTIDTLNAQKQAAANYLYKAQVTFGMLRTPSRSEMVMGQSVQQTAAQLPSATPAVQADTLRQLQTELDETKTSAEALRTQYDRELGVARAEAAAKEATVKDLSVKLDQVDKDRVSVLTKARATEADLQTAKDKVQDADLAAKAKEAADAKRSEKAKMWLMGILLTAAAACGVGAAFVPIPSLKTKLIIGAAVCGGAAIAIPFLEAWMIMVTIGVCLLGIAAWVINDYRREHGDATDTYRALNEVKTKASAAFKAEVAPILDQWHTNPDTSKRIDERLKAVGDT